MKSPKVKLSKYINKSVITGTVVGIILTFFLGKVFDPICEAIYSFILQVGDHFISSFSNSVYREISKGLSEQASYSLFYLCILVVSAFIGYVQSSIYSFCKKTIDQLTDCDERIQILEHSDDASSKKEQSVSTENNLSILRSQIAKVKKITKLFRFTIITLITIIFIRVVVMYGRQVFIHEKAVTAINNIEIIAPYISDHQYKQFKSTFHLIQNKQDYDSLLSSLENIALRENILLPEQDFK